MSKLLSSFIPHPDKTYTTPIYIGQKLIKGDGPILLEIKLDGPGQNSN